MLHLIRLLQGLALVVVGWACISCETPDRDGPPPTALQRQLAAASSQPDRSLQDLIDKLTGEITEVGQELSRLSMRVPSDPDPAPSDNKLHLEVLQSRIDRLENEWAGIKRMVAQFEQLKQEGIGRPDIAACEAALNGLRREWRDRFSQITGR